MSDTSESRNRRNLPEGDLGAAFVELASNETLAQVSHWAARWLAAVSGADAVLVWTADPAHSTVVCTGAIGEGIGRVLQRSVPRGEGLARRLIRDGEPFALTAAEILVADDPWLVPTVRNFRACLAVPLSDEGSVIGMAALLFREEGADVRAALSRSSSLIPHAAQAVSRAMKQDRKTSGMLHAIERLTNLYDLSKAFGATLEWGELTAIIAQKAVDFANAEVATLWILEGAEGEVAMAATSVSENYEIENAPDSVGASIVGDALGAPEVSYENDLSAEHLLRAEGPFAIRSVLTLPLLEDDQPVGVLVIVNKRGRRAEFDENDVPLLTDLAHQAVRALHNARRLGAERRAEELDQLLAVSREITSTLDLDRVMQTVANATAAFVSVDRCAVAVVQRGKLRLGAVSGIEDIQRSEPSIVRTTNLLEWVHHGGNDVSVKRQEDGTIEADRPETEEKFRVFFDESGMNSFFAIILQDEEGKLGVIGFESSQPLEFGDDGRDLLQILINQATVALRNAQLYQAVPLAGFWKPLLEKQKKLAALPKTKLWRRVGIATAVILALVILPWNIRLSGSARVFPGHRTALTAPIPGVIAAVRHREGDLVPAGDVVVELYDSEYRAAAAQAHSDLEIAVGEYARHQSEGNAPGMAKAGAQLEEARAKYAVAEDNLAQTRLRAPTQGVLITPHLDERVGQMVQSGAEIAVLADTRSVEVEISVPEIDSGLLREGQDVKVKLNSYPSEAFRGKVGRISPVVREEGEKRYVTAQATLENPRDVIRPGMLGRAKISTGTRRLGYAVFRKPARWFWSKIWPLMP